ncbi:hypothetical protein BCR33DRAFT_583373 [Rhizoclosmatium globosum]|uniref:Zn(2)-C6 fungal-type domain-containing protein n=1 Tax=Rhizoclosmatium globosum TaxID=329046 RepID=A0A1Y2CR84_9FUNG|nr:hypothetical protein BCR33DRAFT_583373 [Rhizoclosmatium globosum]|eukprot:ORY49467.1 hypothetical protein BCR33DRAFT_583373 [Rhizoclosmatium globosum]
MSSVSRPSQRTSCSSCQKSKRGCRLLPGTLVCGQCEKRGLAESCDILLYPSHYPRSCDRCSKHHKKCVKNAFGCESCSDAGLECSVSPISSGSGSVVSDFVPRHVRIDQIITAMEKPLLDEYITEDWDIQDPDLMPTYEDYYHVQAFFKSNTVVIMRLST